MTLNILYLAHDLTDAAIRRRVMMLTHGGAQDDGVKGRMLRMAEAGFGRRAQMLMTSSPAFIEHYFARRSRLKIPAMLVENKVLDLTDVPAAAPLTPRAPEAGRPWRIGWFGALRCRKSLSILTEFAERMDGRVQIVE